MFFEDSNDQVQGLGYEIAQDREQKYLELKN